MATDPSLDPGRRWWDPEVQTMPRPQLAELQAKRLREAVGRAHEQSAFFRDWLDRAGVAPDDVTGPADLRAIPPVVKDDLRADEAANPPIGTYRCAGPRHSVRLATSTGTTGRPTFILWTRADLDLDYDLAARAHWRAGLRPGMTVVTAHPGYLNGGQSMTAGAYEHMGILPVSIGPPTDLDHAETVLRTLADLPIDQWRVFPAALARLREAAARADLDVDLPEPSAADARAQYLKLSAGQECISYLGSACDERDGAHIAEDAAVVEVLDVRTGEPVADGTRGSMVVTSLGRDNPTLRYDLQDVVRLESTPCACGETSRRGYYEGRVKDIVWVDDRMILPIDVWMELPGDAEYVLVRRPHADRLTVRIEDPVDDVADRISARVGVPVEVEALEPGTLSRSGYKSVRVVDES